MAKNYIEQQGLKCHWNFILLPKGFLAITLFGHIFFRKSKSELQAYLLSSYAKYTLNHERIHVLQAQSFKTKYLGFYIYYLWYWFIGLFKYGIKNHQSYYNIPFEREAYRHESDFNYKESHWKEYIY